MRQISRNNPAPLSRASVFLHAPTGMGKSTFAIVGGKPLVIITEPKAMAHLNRLNPNAEGIVPESTDDLLKIFELLGDPEQTRPFDRIVLDSYSDLTTNVAQWMKGAALLLKLEIQEYGDLGNWCLGLVKAIQLSGLPSVIIARSTVKKFGRIEKVVPDGLGRSIEALPGKCLPTAEARFDPEHGWVIDTTPDDCSQRCGLPWLPQIWTGNCLDYILNIEHGKTPAEQNTAPRGPEPSRSELREHLAELQTKAINNKPAISPETDAFVDGLVPNAPNEAPAPRASAEDSRELLDLCEKHGIKTTQMASYLVKQGYMTDPQNWFTVTNDGYLKAVSALKDPRARHSLIKWLNTNHPA